MAASRRIILVGLGAIGSPVADRLLMGDLPGNQLVGIVTTRQLSQEIPGIQHFTAIEQALDLSPDLVIEAGGGDAFRQCVPTSLARGADVLAVSLAAMADLSVEAIVQEAIAEGNSRLLAASGAVAALEALSAAREAGLSSVTLTQRKPLRAFPGQDVSPDKATVVSSGSARDAALAFPKNANIAAAIAMAGIGFDATRVTVIADPTVNANIAELTASGEFGELTMSIGNRPSDINPSTAKLAGLSVIAALRRLSASIVVPA